jgi:hypothetical protein
MPSLPHAVCRLLEIALCAAILLLAPLSVGQERVVVAIISDGPGDRLASQQQEYTDELLVLTSDEFDIQLKTACWGAEQRELS